MSFNYSDIKTEIDSIDALIADYKSFEITAPSVAELQAFVNGLQETINRQSMELERAQQRERELSTTKDEFQKEVTDKKEEITSTLQLIKEYELRIATLEANAQTSNSENSAQLDVLRTERDRQVQELETLKIELAEIKTIHSEVKEKLKLYREHISKLQDENRTSRLMMLDATEQKQKRERSPQSGGVQAPNPTRLRQDPEFVSAFDEFQDVREADDDGIDLTRIQKIEDILKTTVTPATKVKNLEKPRFTKAELTYALKRRGQNTENLNTNKDLIEALAKL